MQRSRSRFPERPRSTYWGGGSGSREPESEEQQQLLDVLEKFRKLRPYLNKRLKSILAAGREREFADLVDDIRYYLNVMNDLIADEHHGMDTILGFIENVHEMIRTDPMPLENNMAPESNDDDDYNDEPIDQPRSPSPSPASPGSPFGSNSQSTQPVRIPEEREWNEPHNPYQDKDTRHLAPDVWNASSSHMAFAYSRRSGPGHADVDMRMNHDARFPDSEAFNPAGRGPLVNNQRRPSGDNMGGHDNYSRSHSREDMYRDRKSDIDRRFDRRERESDMYHRDRNNDRFQPAGNFRDRGPDWEGNHSGAESFDRRNSDRTRHSNDQWSGDRDRDRKNWFPDRSYKRDVSFERDSDHRNPEHLKQMPQEREHREPLDESLFERRPKPVTSEPISSSSNDIKPHYSNFNHAPSGKDPSPVRRADDHRDKDMRSPLFPGGVTSGSLVQTASVPNISPNSLVPKVDTSIPNVASHHPVINPISPNVSLSNTFQPAINMNLPLANQNVTPAQLQVMMQGMAAMFHNLQQQQQGMNPQQPPMNPQQLNQLLLNSQNLTTPGASSPNLNLPNVNNVNLNQNVSQPNMANQNLNPPNLPNNNMRMGFNQPPPNRYGGLLPTPTVTNDFRFQNPTNTRMFRPPSTEVHSPAPGAMNNYNSRQNNHSNMISQIRQKAQHHFSRGIRPSFGRRDGPNFQNGPHGPPNNQLNQSFPPRPAVPPTPPASTPAPPTKTPILATNQMLAEPPTLDPRLNRANRNTQARESIQPKESQSQSESVNTSSASEASANNKRRVELNTETKPKVAARVPPQKITNKFSTLSDFKKDLLKEGMITLGDKSSKSKKPSFEESLLLAPVKPQVVATKSPKRLQSVKDISKDEHDNVDSGSQKKTTTDKEKTKTHSRSSLKPTRNSKGRRSSTESSSSSSSSIVPRSSNSSSKKSSSKCNEIVSNEASSTSKMGVSKLNFRIPKIKKPEPVVEEVTIETPTSSSPKPSDSHEEEEFEKNCPKPADSNVTGEVASSTTPTVPADDTEDLIRTFILKSMSSTDVERLNSNPEVYNEITKKLQEHLKKIVTDDKDDKPSSSTGDSTTSTVTESTEQPIEKETVGEKLESPPIKKRGPKRRSDLEKLHDALKEMRFDSMLPLGPRRCTNKATLEENAAESAPAGNESVKLEETKPTETPKLKNSVDEIIESQVNFRPPVTKKKGKTVKKVITPKKSAKTMKVQKSKAMVVKMKKVVAKEGTSLEDLPQPCKPKRGRKRKLEAPNVTSVVEKVNVDESVKPAEKEDNGSAPRRYSTRLQAKKIVEPEPPTAEVQPEPEPELKPRSQRTGWEKWDKLAVMQKKKQDEKNKKFVATFSASKIKLKLKNQLKLKQKIEKGVNYSQKQKKKSKVAIGPNNIVVNSGLGKIKLETDYYSPDLKDTDFNNTDITDHADMNHLICDAVSAVISVVNTNSNIDDKDSTKVKQKKKDSIPTSSNIIEEQTQIGVRSAELHSDEYNGPTDLPSLDEGDSINMEDSLDFEIIGSKVIDESLSMELANNLESSTSTSGMVTRRGRKRKMRSDMFNCKLCPFSGKKIVSHYVNIHVDSTIPEACIEKSIFDSLVEQNTSTSPQLFEISYKEEKDEKPWPCLYCTERYIDVREYFEHLTTHTGEFMYGCGICSARHPHLKMMINHLKSHKLKESTGELNKNLITLYEPTVELRGTELYAYMCHDCNYFQLLSDSISKHLETENHSASEAICIKFHGPEINPYTGAKQDPFDRSVFLGTDDATEAVESRKGVQDLELSLYEIVALQSQFLRLKGAELNLDLISELSTPIHHKKENFEQQGSLKPESQYQTSKECKDALDWIVGIVESELDPELKFECVLDPQVKFNSLSPTDGDDSNRDFAEVVEIDLTTAILSEDDSDTEIVEDEDKDIQELWAKLRRKSKHEEDMQIILPQVQNVRIVTQGQYDIIKIVSNKERIVDCFWPTFQTYKHEVVHVNRIGDGYDYSILLRGYMPPSVVNMEFRPNVALPESEKLRMGIVGGYRAGIKDIGVYQEMLSPKKLKDLFKCMGKSCSFTTDSPNEFYCHLNGHEMKIEDAEYSEQNWIACSYCSLQYKKTQDLCSHIVNQHSQSLFQCGHCFYRALYDKYVQHHQNQSHPGESPNVLFCLRTATTKYIDSTDIRASLYRCSREYCPERASRFLFRDEFLEHVQKCVPPGSPSCCHICAAEYADCRYLVCHYKKHGVFRFQCFHCIFGTEELIDMETHVLEIHPNLPGRIFDRTSKDGKTNVKVTLEQLAVALNTTAEKDKESVANVDCLPSSNYLSVVRKEDPIEDSEKEGRVTNREGKSLYRCANVGCKFAAATGTIFRDHIGQACGYMPEDKMISCFHCPKTVKNPFSLMEHIKIHGKQRQMCSLCRFKCCVNSELTKHFKNVHKVANYRVVKSLEDGDDGEATIYPKDVAAKLVFPETLQENFMLFSNKARFLPSDIGKIPTTSIFASQVSCGLCSFSTKVRTNIIRHLYLHLRSEVDGGKTVVPKTAPVNPVPCLERNELMFDKMTNWAGSSHQNKQIGGVTKEDAARLPQFVKEQFRYECSVPNCQQITVDDSMLRAHMKALHSEVDTYRCPHCRKSDKTSSDSRNSVPIDKIGNHLKFHGPKLFRCGHCDYIHTHSRVMEKHVSEKHVEKKPIHYLIRDFDDDGNTANRRTSVEENKQIDIWRCALCAYKTQFVTWEDTKSHSMKHHNVTGQFACSSCPYSTDYVFEIISHVSGSQCENPSVAAEKGQILITFCRHIKRGNFVI